MCYFPLINLKALIRHRERGVENSITGHSDKKKKKNESSISLLLEPRERTPRKCAKAIVFFLRALSWADLSEKDTEINIIKSKMLRQRAVANNHHNKTC